LIGATPIGNKTYWNLAGINAIVILREIQSRGYTGGYTISEVRSAAPHSFMNPKSKSARNGWP